MCGCIYIRSEFRLRLIVSFSPMRKCRLREAARAKARRPEKARVELTLQLALRSTRVQKLASSKKNRQPPHTSRACRRASSGSSEKSSANMIKCQIRRWERELEVRARQAPPGAN